MTLKTLRHIGICGVSCLSVFITGCASLDAVGTFAEGAAMLSAASQEFYAMELDTDRRLAAYTVDLADAADTWEPVTAGKNLIAESRRHQAAVDALTQYAVSLHEIAAFDTDDAIEASSRELGESLVSLASVLDIGEPDESALATAIERLGKLYIHTKTQKVVRERVRLAQPHVETIVNSLVHDIERQQKRLRLNRLSTAARRETWFKALRTDYAEAAASERAYRSMAAGYLVSDELKDILADGPARAFLAKLKETAASCLIAHRAIQDPGVDERAKALVDFMADAKRLVSAVRKL